MDGSKVEACSIPCIGCPVGGLDDKMRHAVDVVFQLHGPEFDPFGGVNADPEVVTEWASEAISFVNEQPNDQTVPVVAAAVTRIAFRECPNY